MIYKLHFNGSITHESLTYFAKVGRKEKDMDMVGPKKGVKPISLG